MDDIVLTPTEFAEAMKHIADMRFIDDSHYAGDELMCNLLRSMGYQEGVEIFENMDRWYA